ncbi:hypothetical protein COY16_03640 [Candidatus Roizmanbacteria bacterium CG_4_10_14_0_2_um_filter_39_13]|uniref:Uncharacterized protein n=1 Tax=Candidatus Roizmanbacteria bacterium CG_4_10_14_0_2_um_filter_39_13 TaxID=1974825 RepID=A0A2M7TYI4_9BACT|nr:MAG: hypothetical protein COY16_03640 [Candidatus Roizmanbacteria bacterium CG_4_10_14_0_2_um_filter_39_13]
MKKRHNALIVVPIVMVGIGVFIFFIKPDFSSGSNKEPTTMTDVSPTQSLSPTKKVDQTPTPEPTKQKKGLLQKIYSPTPAKDTTAPKAYILEPEDNAVVTLGTDVKIVANVTDDVQIDRVEFYAGSGDYQHIGTVKQAPFEVIWNVDSRFDGSINIPVYIKAFDSSGNRADSSIAVVAKKP